MNNGNYQQAPRSRSLNDTYDSASTLKAMRRKPEEFEVINRGGKTELGKGSYGSVKLVKDKQNGKEFAMKIVLYWSRCLDAKTLDILILYC